MVTTRLDPERFGIGRDLRPFPVDSLRIDDAVAPIRDFQPDGEFANELEANAAKEIIEMLGGFTLAIEMVAAYLWENIQKSDQQPTLKDCGMKDCCLGIRYPPKVKLKPEFDTGKSHFRS